MITPSSEIRKIVWLGAINLWKMRPIFGTGVETFGYTYYWARPISHNLTSEWDFLYNKAHNEYLNYLATTGIVGLLSYLVLPLSFLFYLSTKELKRKKDHKINSKNYLLWSSLYGIVSILITNFFGFSVTPIALFFFLLPGLALMKKDEGEEDKGNINDNPDWDKLIINSILFAFFVFKIGTYWLADYHFAKGTKLEKSGYLDTSLAHLDTAIKLNPGEPNLYAQRGVIYAKTVATLAQKNQDEDLSQVIQKAINDSEKSLKISPYHINFYKNEAKIYYYLAFADIEYLRKGIETLKKAAELAPTDAKITYNLGLMYQTLDENEKAREYLEKTLELKPNYLEAKVALERNSQPSL